MIIKNELVDIELLDKNGFCDINRIDVQHVIEELIIKYRENYTIETTTLIPKEESFNFKKTLSSVYGFNEFPYHTDGANVLIPPRWMILEYLNEVPSKTSTLLFDTINLQQKMRYHDFFFNDIYLVHSNDRQFLSSIVTKNLHKFAILRWNPLVMKLLSKSTDQDRPLSNLKEGYRVEWTANRAILIDNWRILHSREKVEVIETNQRIIKRTNLTPVIKNAGIRL